MHKMARGNCLHHDLTLANTFPHYSSTSNNSFLHSRSTPSTSTNVYQSKTGIFFYVQVQLLCYTCYLRFTMIIAIVKNSSSLKCVSTLLPQRKRLFSCYLMKMHNRFMHIRFFVTA